MKPPAHALAALAGAAGLAATPAAWAQTDQPGGPVIVGQREQFQAVQLVRLDAALNFFGQWTQDRQTASGQSTLNSYEQVLRGDAELSGRAFIGRQELLDLTGVVRYGLEFIDVDSDVPTAAQNDDRDFWLYDISGRFFSQSKLPTRVFTSRQETLLDRAFASTIRSTNSEYGIESRLVSDIFPLVASYVHRDVDQNDPFGAAGFTVRQDTFSLLSDSQITDNQHLTVEYRFDSIDETRSGNFVNSFDRHDLIGTHTLDFGPQSRHSLRSIARYFDENGIFDQNRFRLDEILRLEHSDTFETRYDFVYENRDLELESQDLYRGQALARYKLYDSLISTAAINGQHIDVHDIGTNDQYGAELNFQYTKRVPYGRLDATAGVGYIRQVQSDFGQPVSVPDTPVLIPDVGPAVVPVANVVPGSVIVTDVAGIRVYIEGVDYDLVVYPDRFEINRIIGGAIAPNETVLVDYTIGPQPGATIDNVASNISLRYTVEDGLLAGISPYFRYSRIDRWLDTDAPEFFFVDDVQDILYGIEYRNGPYFLKAEQQFRDSQFSPFDATRFQAGYNQRLGIASSLTLNYTFEMVDRPLDNDTLRINRAILRWYGQIDEDLDFGITLLYRDEDSRVFGDSKGFEQNLELNWSRGRTSATVAIRNANLDANNTSSSSQSLRVGLRRTF